MRLSKSRINLYDICPHAFKLKYIDGIKETKVSKAMERGKEIHQVYEDFYKPPTQDVKELNKRIEKHPHYEKYKKEIKKLTKLTEKTGIPLYREIELYDPELNIIGIIDRVDFNGKSIAVIDYKSGKMKPMIKFRFELALYTYLFEKIHNQTATHWGIYFIDSGKLVLEEKDTNEMKKAIEKVQDIRKKIKNKEFPKGNHPWCPYWNSGLCCGR